MYSHPNGTTNSTDLQDYYDHIPPAHRLSHYSSLSGQNIPLAPTASSSVVNLAQDTTPYSDIPARTRPHYGDRRGEFANTPFVEEKSPSSRNRKRWVMIGLALVIVAAIVAIVVGVVLSQEKKSSSSSSSDDDSVSGDPSQFSKDSRLKQSFWGIAYTPEGTLYPDCGAKQSDVITDIQLLSQLTTRIRLYGADCNTTALVLNAINLTKVNLTVYIANYPQSDDNGEAYNRQKDAIKSAIQTYGSDHIAGVTVGNEFILNYLNANGATDPNSATGNAGGKILIQYIDDTKSMLQDLSLSSMKVGNADAGSYFNNLVLEEVGYGMANVHPWFANVSIDQAAGWTYDFFQNNDVALSKELSNTPEMSIAETGWPTKSSDAGNESNGPSTASEENLQKFLNTFVCQANANGTEYFFFELFDEKWKDEKYGGVEGWWGLFNGNRTLKNIEIPDCSGSSSSSS
ncbi:glycoside hydrolase family 17 protein [Collybiopsis luxurians FD-317 M1]|uniref:glucan endo-1,3-beta-D-glucosidase n=1 Tax=Collybiopsis luxurians FD-317 M1 TaxID=944289 RepID=A0A0D0AWF1_9AGAR|nr:glycoside hydrolase family 17 protein [Collybiopsis luxurians FD-317 M1]